MCYVKRVGWAFIPAFLCCWQDLIGLRRWHLVSPWWNVFFSSRHLVGPQGPIFTKMQLEAGNTTFASWSACCRLSFEPLNALARVESDFWGHMSCRLMTAYIRLMAPKFGLPDPIFPHQVATWGQLCASVLLRAWPGFVICVLLGYWVGSARVGE